MEFNLENPIPTSNDHHYEIIISLFSIESDQMPSKNVKARDNDINIRRETISFILHLSHNFDTFLSYLAINYLDRFLCIQPKLEGKPWILRLLAVCCISLALKMRKMEFSIIDIQQDGGFIFNTQTIQRMELLILGALKWRMRSITPFSFISFFVSFFKFKDPPLTQALRARAMEIIFKAQNEIKLLEFKPSIVAASTLLSASHELFPLQFPCFRKAISNCPYVNKDDLFGCYNVMQDIFVMDGYESVLDLVSRWSTTPVNVLDLQCSYSSDGDKTNPTEASAIGLENELKRRKIGGFRGDNAFHLSPDSTVLMRL